MSYATRGAHRHLGWSTRAVADGEIACTAAPAVTSATFGLSCADAWRASKQIVHGPASRQPPTHRPRFREGHPTPRDPLDGRRRRYLPGDALGVASRTTIPRWSSACCARSAPPATSRSPAADGATLPLHRALTDVYNLTRRAAGCSNSWRRAARRTWRRSSIRANAEAPQALPHRLERGARRARRPRGVTRDIRLTPAELVEALRKTLPRLYSVASSLRAHPGEVHLLVVSVRYTIRGRERAGRLLDAGWPSAGRSARTAEMYLQNQQKHFAMPAESDDADDHGRAGHRPRAVSRLRRGAARHSARPAGTGCSSASSAAPRDFFYEEELTGYVRDGLLRLDVAFSRDQAAEGLRPAPHARARARHLGLARRRAPSSSSAATRNAWPPTSTASCMTIVETAGGRTPDQAPRYVEAAPDRRSGTNETCISAPQSFQHKGTKSTPISPCALRVLRVEGS